MGTALTSEQARLLRRFAPQVVLVYDGDDAGRLAAERSIDLLLEEGLEVRVALLPQGKDVDEVLLEEGPDRLREILDGARDVFDFKYDVLAARHDLASVRGRALAAEALLGSARRVRSALERDLLFRRISERLGVAEETLRTQAAREPRSRPRRAAGAAVAPTPDVSPDRDALLEQEWLVAGAALRPLLLPAIAHALSPEEIADPGLASLYRAILSVRAAGHPVHVEALARQVASDPAAAAALARLPDAPRLDERVEDALRALTARKAVLERRRAVQAALGGPGE
jgi:DNA primase